MSDTVSDAEIDWIRTSPVGGLRFGKSAGQTVVDWPHLGRLLSSPSTGSWTFLPDAGADRSALEKFAATELLACRRYLDGKLSLHASAVAFREGAVALVGDSGAGKSTTAMALVRDHGAKFLADDILPIDWHGNLACVGAVDDDLWLGPESLRWFGLEAPTGGRKRPCAPRDRGGSGTILRAIVRLDFDESAPHPTLQPLAGAASFVAVSRAHACYAGREQDAALENLEVRARLADSVPVLALRRRRDLSNIDVAIRELDAYISRLGGGATQ